MAVVEEFWNTADLVSWYNHGRSQIEANNAIELDLSFSGNALNVINSNGNVDFRVFRRLNTINLSGNDYSHVGVGSAYATIYFLESLKALYIQNNSIPLLLSPQNDS